MTGAGSASVASLDTNVLVRFLVEDDTAQLAAARRLVRQAVNADEPLWVPLTVALELEWVLRAGFGFGKPEVMRTYSQLLSTRELRFQDEGVIETTLALYGDSHADFSDCMHIALAGHAGQPPLWTFDKAAAKVAGARRLSA